MKELTIVKEFRDCDDFAVVYREGQKHLFEEGRAKRIVSLGLAVETSDSCDKAVCAGKSDHDDTTTCGKTKTATKKRGKTQEPTLI